MISVEQARAQILAHVAPLPPESVTLWEARTRVLASPIVAPHDVPPFRNAAMDGYAVRAADVVAATANSPLLLRVVGEVPAGQLPTCGLAPGEAMRIMTGAIMPDGADAVVRFEESSEGWPVAQRPDAPLVAICTTVPPQANVREAGEDVRTGSVVLDAGTVLHPAHIGLLASLGISAVPVIRQPRVAILATGDELLPADAPLEPGKIRNSNEYATAALVAQAGGVPVPLGIARDTAASLAAKLHEGLEAGVDLFLTSAGVSVGDYDMVKAVLAEQGEMAFWQVAIKPGKPLAFGTLRHAGRAVPLLGLPGNPVAAMVAFHTFALPALRRLGGRTPLLPPVRRARLMEAVENSGRRHYMRAFAWRDADEQVQVTTRSSAVQVQGSGILSSMVWANCFVVVPDGVTHVPMGALIDIEMFTWSEEKV